MALADEATTSATSDLVVRSECTVASGETRIAGTVTIQTGATLTVDGTLICSALTGDGQVILNGTVTIGGIGLSAGEQSSRFPVAANTDQVSVFVAASDGSAPADVTVITERYSDKEARWMEYGRTSITSASTPQSFVDPAIPKQMGYTLQNDSGSSAEYQLNVVSY